ncbi:hypothetical protein ON010_g5303 [Phytophthora cinnamomi]|nr:hypothetical protein ON010_g5303 [Phytophthora cinnamomi]
MPDLWGDRQARKDADPTQSQLLVCESQFVVARQVGELRLMLSGNEEYDELILILECCSGRDHGGIAGGADDPTGQEAHRGQLAGEPRQGGGGAGRDGAARPLGERGRGQHRPDDQAQAVPVEVGIPVALTTRSR